MIVCAQQVQSTLKQRKIRSRLFIDYPKSSVHLSMDSQSFSFVLIFPDLQSKWILGIYMIINVCMKITESNHWATRGKRDDLIHFNLLRGN